MKLSNGTEVFVRPYREQDAEKIVGLIRRNHYRLEKFNTHRKGE